MKKRSNVYNSSAAMASYSKGMSFSEPFRKIKNGKERVFKPKEKDILCSATLGVLITKNRSIESDKGWI